MKKSILRVMGFVVTVAVLFIGCEDAASPNNGNLVDGFLVRVNQTPGTGGGDGEYSFELTVSSRGAGATRSGDFYVKGQTVKIYAGSAEEGWEFEQWTTQSDGVTFFNNREAETTFNMPAHEVTVTAVFKQLKYTVTVSAGTGAKGGGDYPMGAAVTITAGAVPTGYDKFEYWMGNVVFDNANSMTTTFTMPSREVTVTAVFVTSDSKTYRTVTIGNQTWMAENLNVRTSEGSWCYDNEDSNCVKYGRLYDWETAKTVCPSGWHLPSNEEWGTLAKTAGGTGDYGEKGYAGTKLKTTSGWATRWGNGSDDFGFSALPGGVRRSDGFFDGVDCIGNWWTATAYSGTSTEYDGEYRYMDFDNDEVLKGNSNKSEGFSVRCIKND